VTYQGVVVGFSVLNTLAMFILTIMIGRMVDVTLTIMIGDLDDYDSIGRMVEVPGWNVSQC
jgi:hypothetical protein